MVGNGSEPPWSTRRIEELLETWFVRVDSGGDPDLLELCGGDEELAAHLALLIDREHEVTESAAALRPERAEPPEESTRPPIDRLGPYRLLDVLGEGGMATVYLGIEEPLERAVAVKVLHAAAATDETLKLRFKREAEITAALDHPNIVPVLTVGEDEGRPYLVMKLIAGPSLALVDKPLAPLEVARLGTRLARALHEAHVSGVIHRDVKPSNIVLDGEAPVLLDFGLAHDLVHSSLTRTGSAAGTLLYMSPEQLQGASSLDPRTDVYSLGATLYELATGRPPFVCEEGEEELASLIRRILLHDPPPMRPAARDRDLEIVLRRAMEKDRSLRFDSALALAEDLERYVRDEPIHSRPAPLHARVRKLARRHPGVTILAAVLGLVILGFSAVLLLDEHGQRRLYENELRRARVLVDSERDTARARELIALLGLRDRSDARLAALAAECDALDALEDFLDVIHEYSETGSVYDDADLRRQVGRLRERGGDRVRRPVSDYALALAHLYLDDRESARSVLEAAPERAGLGRALTALGALVSGVDVAEALAEETAWTADDTGGDTVDGHVLAALGLRIDGASLAEQQREIESALAEDGSHYRAREARALLERRKGNHERAYGLFMGLSVPGGHRPATLLHLAYEGLILGEVDFARSCLDAIPPENESARQHLMAAQLLRHEGRVGDVIDHVRRAIERWPEDGNLQAELGSAQLARGELDAAEQTLTRALELEPRRAARERAECTLIGIALQRRQRDIAAGASGDHGAALVGLLTRCDAAGAASIDRLVRSDLHLLASRVHLLFGDPEPMWTRLRRSLEEDPMNPAARSFFALRVAERAVTARLQARERGTSLADADLERDLARAEGFVADLRAGRSSAERPIPAQCRQDAAYCAFLYAFVRDDVDALDRSYDDLPRAAPLYWEQARGDIDHLRSLAIHE